MRKLIPILLILVIITSSCQPSKKEKQIEKTRFNYVDYNTLIYQAERFILDSNYTSALDKYNEAFSIVDKPLAKHCFTAIQVSAKVDDEEAFKRFSIKGFERGLLIKYYKQDTVISRYSREKKLNTTIEQSFEEANKLYNASINKFLADTLIALQDWDQKWKKYYVDSLSRVDIENSKFYHQKYDSIVGTIVEDYLIPVIKEYGYPGERLVGAEAVGYGENDSYRRSYVNNSAKIILLHYYADPRTCVYNELFLSEVKKGNLLPEHYASIIDFQAKYGNGEHCKVDYYNEWFYDPDTTNINQINNKRMEIGLSPFQDRIEKMKRGQDKCKSIRRGDYNFVKLFEWCG
ncbi:hypothetical protein [Joostella sp.]|uniref:hypothetical protein n=1 Tax=Joostella sp. TaxID=2231138 RepID=UPI003A8F13A6